MAQLLVRDIPEETVAALKKRAKENGRSAEAEHRAILDAALKPKEFSDFWARAESRRNELSEQGRIFDSTEILRRERDRR
jgi:plasmid stability protein